MEKKKENQERKGKGVDPSIIDLFVKQRRRKKSSMKKERREREIS